MTAFGKSRKTPERGKITHHIKTKNYKDTLIMLDIRKSIKRQEVDLEIIFFKRDIIGISEVYVAFRP